MNAERVDRRRSVLRSAEVSETPSADTSAPEQGKEKRGMSSDVTPESVLDAPLPHKPISVSEMSKKTTIFESAILYEPFKKGGCKELAIAIENVDATIGCLDKILNDVKAKMDEEEKKWRKIPASLQDKQYREGTMDGIRIAWIAIESALDRLKAERSDHMRMIVKK